MALGTLSFRSANRLWLAAGRADSAAFFRALAQPQAAQEQLLLSLLRRNAQTDFGRRHRFASIRHTREFQDRVPVRDYEAHLPWIERVLHGERSVLTREPVLMVEKTSGSARAAKYIPYTASLRREFSRAVAPWMADLFQRRPWLLDTGSYWSISPLSARPERTPGGLPVGFTEDREYFGVVEKHVLGRLMLVPGLVARIHDLDAARYVTLLFLLRSEGLGWASVWNPSFLTLLLDDLPRHWTALVRDIERGALSIPLPEAVRRDALDGMPPDPRRAHQLWKIVDRWGPDPERIWPRFSLVSCWADAAAGGSLPGLRKQLPGVEVQPKGLLATEGIVSLPIGFHPHGVLAVTSHFLEFVDEASPGSPPLPAHALERDGTYRVLLTTGGGLYRYPLGDRVRVTGFLYRTPRIEFLGRADVVSDLCGEKLNGAWVAECLQSLDREVQWSMLAPEWEPHPHYLLLMETNRPMAAADAAAHLDRQLRRAHHYDYCRRLGQLGPILPLVVQQGERLYLDRCRELGQRAGNIKPVPLHTVPGWRAWLASRTGPEQERTPP